MRIEIMVVSPTQTPTEDAHGGVIARQLSLIRHYRKELADKDANIEHLRETVNELRDERAMWCATIAKQAEENERLRQALATPCRCDATTPLSKGDALTALLAIIGRVADEDRAQVFEAAGAYFGLFE